MAKILKSALKAIGTLFGANDTPQVAPTMPAAMTVAAPVAPPPAPVAPPPPPTAAPPPPTAAPGPTEDQKAIEKAVETNVKKKRRTIGSSDLRATGPLGLTGSAGDSGTLLS